MADLIAICVTTSLAIVVRGRLVHTVLLMQLDAILIRAFLGLGRLAHDLVLAVFVMLQVLRLVSAVLHLLFQFAAVFTLNDIKRMTLLALRTPLVTFGLALLMTLLVPCLELFKIGHHNLVTVILESAGRRPIGQSHR